MFAEARASSERFAREEGCTVEWSRIWNIELVPFHPALVDLCEQVVVETAGKAHRLPSGLFNDAGGGAQMGVPSVMMFVQSLGGISHNRIEDTKEEHIRMSIEALDKLASHTIDWTGGNTAPVSGDHLLYGTKFCRIHAPNEGSAAIGLRPDGGPEHLIHAAFSGFTSALFPTQRRISAIFSSGRSRKAAASCSTRALNAFSVVLTASVREAPFTMESNPASSARLR